jgi:hypothetical protein
METNCSPVVADFFHHSYQADYFPLLNNSNIGDYVDCIYPIELDIKDITYTASTYRNWQWGEVKNENFTTKVRLSIFPILNVEVICRNILVAPAYVVHIF